MVVPEAIRGADGLQVQRDGAPIATAQWGVAVPVDKGRHTITVGATGHERWETELAVADGEATAITLALGTSSRRGSDHAAP